jgi:hypothetical protein
VEIGAGGSWLTLALVALFGLAATGCGTHDSGRPAHPQTVRLDWHENCGTRADPIPITTRRLVVHKHRWLVELSFRNETRVALGVIRPHYPGSTYFGLEPFKTASWTEVLARAGPAAAKPRTIADRFHPSKPTLVQPRAGWAGSFSGPGALPAGVPIRVVLGRFVVRGKTPPRFVGDFLCISRRVVRLE